MSDSALHRMWTLPSQLTRQPRSRDPPIAHHRLRRNVENLRRFLNGDSAKETQLDDLGPPGIHPQYPEHDIVLLVTVPRKDADANVVLLNGSSRPAMREMRIGEHYRLRLINIHTFRPAMRIRLLRDTTLLEWRALAKDGMDLPAEQAILGPAEIQMGNGETYDFDFVPAAVGDLHFDVTSAAGVLLVSMPIRVR